jgi:DNA modification methylase
LANGLLKGKYPLISRRTSSDDLAAVTGQWLSGRKLSEEDYYGTIHGAYGIVRASTSIEALAMRNQWFCGDNWDVLRHCVADESVDLVYLDPPFKKHEIYNVLFREKDGTKSASQILAFEDAWEWNVEAERNYAAVANKAGKLGQIMAQFHTMFPSTDMLAYLSMMAPRLVELQRVLRPTGSIYLHCDPTASHYLKMLMDAIFGPTNFRNEIVWKRSHAHNSANRFGCNHDIILFYSNGPQSTWNRVFQDYDPSYLAKHYRHLDEHGRRYKHENPTGAGVSKGITGKPWRGIDPTVKRRHWARTPDELEKLDAAGLLHWPNKKGAWPYVKLYLDERSGTPAQDTWTDIDPINMVAKERVHYPTQKPLTLLERIISASSNEGDVILDAFCGCGTAIEAAEKLNRRWIGIDITVQAMRVTRKDRLEKLKIVPEYDVIYRPCDISAAMEFAKEQPFQFQDWAVEKLDGVPSRHHSGDRGIDGRMYFKEDDNGRLCEIVVSVKGGKLKAPFIRELQGAVAREHAPMGILIALNQPSKQMVRDAASSLFYTCALGTYPKIQIITIQDILGEKHFDLPPIQKMEQARKRIFATSAASQMPLPGIAS